MEKVSDTLILPLPNQEEAQERSIPSFVELQASFSDDVYFASFQPWMRDRVEGKGSISWTEVQDVYTGFFPIEMNAISSFLDMCKRQYAPDEYALIRKALSYSLIVHRKDFRKSGEPYSLHCIEVGSRIATYGQDYVSVAGGLIHDTHEDHPDEVPLYDIRTLFGDSVSHMVEGMTKIRAATRHAEDVESAEIATHLKVLDALFQKGDPRALIAKICGDVWHNTKTLKGLSSEDLIYKKIGDVLGFWGPLSDLLGMRDVRDDIEREAIKYLGIDAIEKEKNICALLEEFYPDEYVTHVGNEIALVLGDMPADVYVRKPTVAEVFHRVQNKDVDRSDLYLHVDIALNGNTPSNNRPIDLAVQMIGVGMRLNPKFSIDIQHLIDEINNDETDSMSMQTSHVLEGDNVQRLDIQIYEKHAYKRERASLLSLCASRQGKNHEEDTHEKEYAREKVEELSLLYQRAMSLMEKGDDASALVTRLRKRVPIGYMRVVGEDIQQKREKWIIPRECTAIQYAHLISPNTWYMAKSATVVRNNRTIPIHLGDFLQEQDIIHIEYDDMVEWDPEWIHGFPPSSPLRNVIRDHVLHIVGQEEKEPTISVLHHMPMKERVCQSGMKQLQKKIHMIDAGSQLRIGLTCVKDTIFSVMPSIRESCDWEQDFIYHVGLGLVEDTFLSQIAPIVMKENEKVSTLKVGFKKDKEGIMRAITDVTTRLLLSITDFKVNIVGSDGAAWIELYFSPQIAGRLQECADEIENDEDCNTLGISWVERPHAI